MVKIKIYKPSLRLRGATVARLTPDQTVGRSNRSGLSYCLGIFSHACGALVPLKLPYVNP